MDHIYISISFVASFLIVVCWNCIIFHYLFVSHDFLSESAAKHKESIYFRTTCVLSTSSPSTSTATAAVLDLEKLRLPSFEAHSNAVVENRRWTFTGATGPPSGVSLFV